MSDILRIHKTSKSETDPVSICEVVTNQNILIVAAGFQL
jgi:hypothetical protein